MIIYQKLCQRILLTRLVSVLCYQVTALWWLLGILFPINKKINHYEIK